ncbi:hypothetical protein ACTACV_10230 [Pseudomonas syringae]|uniref:hypothetical protein n=1 Tax=Pseudomonas syringae TaxID=317 RepID=UPI003F755A35
MDASETVPLLEGLGALSAYMVIPLAGCRLSAEAMQVGGYRPQFRPHRGVIYPEVRSLQQPTVQLATLQKLTTRGCLIAGFILVLLWTSRQITLRCSLVSVEAFQVSGSFSHADAGAGCSAQISNGDGADRVNLRHWNAANY